MGKLTKKQQINANEQMVDIGMLKLTPQGQKFFKMLVKAEQAARNQGGEASEAALDWVKAAGTYMGQLKSLLPATTQIEFEEFEDRSYEFWTAIRRQTQDQAAAMVHEALKPEAVDESFLYCASGHLGDVSGCSDCHLRKNARVPFVAAAVTQSDRICRHDRIRSDCPDERCYSRTRTVP